jgi:xanthine dehydrogenase accessory factor
MSDIFLRVNELMRRGTLFALATIVHSEDSAPRHVGTRMIVFPDGSIEGTIGGGALEKRVIADAGKLLSAGKSKRFTYDLGKGEEGTPLGMLCGGQVEVFIETFGSRMKIFIFGAGHIGKMLAQLCTILKIAYWVIDNREEYARKELFTSAVDVVHSEFAESFSHLPIDESSYLVIVTYGHRYDGVCLEAALKTNARYIGMIGSRSKVKTLFKSLSDKGVDVKDQRIYSPIGLQLGDNSPEDISISILSEILKVNSGRTGQHGRQFDREK